jgi:hypothetical protein
MAAPAFVKSPRVIFGAILVLWVAYVLYSNFQLVPVEIRLLPFAASLQLKVSAIVIGSAIFGAVITLIIPYIWRRRQSSNRAG